jgi:hypothetical protein
LRSVLQESVQVPAAKEEAMTLDSTKTEKRIWRRFRVQVAATVCMRKLRLIEVGKPKFIPFGPLVDISKGGLMVQYIGNKERGEEFEELAVWVPSDRFMMGPFPFTVVMDKPIATIPGDKTIRKRSVKFRDMTPAQNHQLDVFIRKYTRR